MYDLWHYIGGDLKSSSTGDLGQASGPERGKQRILRRLMTNPGDYLFHPAYGAGLGSKVGAGLSPAELKTLISGQMLLEACVAPVPPPVVSLTLVEQGVSVQIRYHDSVSGTAQSLLFDLTR